MHRKFRLQIKAEAVEEITAVFCMSVKFGDVSSHCPVEFKHLSINLYRGLNLRTTEPFLQTLKKICILLAGYYGITLHECRFLIISFHGDESLNYFSFTYLNFMNQNFINSI